MKEDTNTISKGLPVKVPQIPNFIKVGEQYIHISDFSEDELRQIGAQWIDKLVDHSKRGRKIRETEVIIADLNTPRSKRI